MSDNMLPTTAIEQRAPFGAEEIIFSTGKIARQANGSILANVGETLVLATVVMAPPRAEPMDFFPLTVDYREKAYAAGRFPGGYFKREGRPGEAEILNARLIDRPLRPMFPEGFRQEIQIYINVLSYDGVNPASLVALNAASAALIVSDIPFEKPIAAVRVGFDGSNYIINPTMEQLKTSQLDLIVAGSRLAINMVESGAKMLTEEQMLEALRRGHEAIIKICDAQEELRGKAGKPKSSFTKVEHNASLMERIRHLSEPKFAKITEIYEKKDRSDALDVARDEIIDALADEYPDVKEVMSKVFEDEYSNAMRRRVLESSVRADGRRTDEVRPITIEVDVLPRTHGSALFTRGQTQALGVLTLGTADDVQDIDDLEEVGQRTFYMHYNFPSFSVGEVRPVRGPGRREIGHGALAERSILPIIPDHEKFPYTIRLVSEILESNGSSSMASVCSGCLAMMDGGVPIKAPVAGIAMGLIKEGDKFVVLSDIMGLEDHLGDMDFKVSGSRDGITALQMDIKIEGITFEIIEKALAQAKQGRIHILEKMLAAISESRTELKPAAPRIETIQINPDKIRDVIGSGGKVIREIVAKTGAKIDITDDGKVAIASADGKAMQEAIDWVRRLTVEAEMGAIYTGKVNRIEDFGCFVEILPGKDGLVHISELEPHRVERVEDVCRLGDEVTVKVIGIDEKGKVRLSRKQAMYPGMAPEREEGGGGERRDRGDRGGRSGGGRDRERGDRDRGGRGGERGGRGGERHGRGGDRDRGPRQAGGGRDRDRGPREYKPAGVRTEEGAEEPRRTEEPERFEERPRQAEEQPRHEQPSRPSFSPDVEDELR